jgi:hypothetical protein
LDGAERDGGGPRPRGRFVFGLGESYSRTGASMLYPRPVAIPARNIGDPAGLLSVINASHKTDPSPGGFLNQQKVLGITS